MKAHSSYHDGWKDDAARPPFFTGGAAPHAARISNGPRPHGAGETDSDSTGSSPLSDIENMHFASLIHLPHVHAAATRDALLMMRMAGLDSSDSDTFTTSVDDESKASSPLSSKAAADVQRRNTARERRNERERMRIQGNRDTRVRLREELAKIQAQFDQLQACLEQRSAKMSSHTSMESLWLQWIEMRAHKNFELAKQEPVKEDDAHDEWTLQKYIVLVKEIKRMKEEQLMLERDMRADVVTLTAVSTLVNSLYDNGFMEREPQEKQHDGQSDPMTRLVCHQDFEEGDHNVVMDPIPILDEMLQDDPLTPGEAKELVTETCREMMHVVHETQIGWRSSETPAFGWTARTREDKDDKWLQFKLAQTFQSVTANELMQKTWQMLTNLDDYRKIQPHTQQLRVLQRVSDECWVVGFAVGQRSHRRHSLILVARAVVHGGYLITFRSLPLLRRGTGGSEAMRRRHLSQEAGGMYVDIYSWYNFQEQPSESGDGVECKVIFGGTARNGNKHYLKQLQVEVLSGISHWQSAIGLPQVAMPWLIQPQDAETEPTPQYEQEQANR